MELGLLRKHDSLFHWIEGNWFGPRASTIFTITTVLSLTVSRNTHYMFCFCLYLLWWWFVQRYCSLKWQNLNFLICFLENWGNCRFIWKVILKIVSSFQLLGSLCVTKVVTFVVCIIHKHYTMPLKKLNGKMDSCNRLQLIGIWDLRVCVVWFSLLLNSVVLFLFIMQQCPKSLLFC